MLGYFGEHFFLFFFCEVTRAECCAFRQNSRRSGHFNLNAVQICVQNLLRIGRCSPADRTCRELSYLRIRAAFIRIRRARAIRSSYLALKPALCFFRQCQVIHQLGVLSKRFCGGCRKGRHCGGYI